MKLVRRDSEPPPDGTYRPAAAPRISPAQRAREAAIERDLARYVELECGHMVTKEEIMMYLAWSTDPHKRHYCEKCGKYVDKKPPRSAAAIPENPLF